MRLASMPPVVLFIAVLSLIWIAATLDVFSATPQPTGGAQEQPPNVILILCDDMGWSDIGCYGSEIATPHIDSLARDGLRFTQFYNNAKCTTTRASLVTGLYPRRGKGGLLRKNMLTLGEMLKPRDYQTALSGKWHLGRTHVAHPFYRGFDSYYGLLDGGCNFFDPGRPDPHYKGGRVRYFAENDRRIFSFPADYYTTDAFTDAAITSLRRFARQKRPFFLHLCYTAPHYPLHARPADIAKYRGKYRGGWNELRRQRYERQLAMGLIDQETHPLSETDSRSYPWESAEQDFEDLRMAVYAAMIDSMDQNIGRLLAALDETGLRDNTIVMFLSDNGGCAEEPGGRDPAERNPGPVDDYVAVGPAWGWAQNTPFRRYKSWVNEGGVRTPFIVRWPARIKAGSMTREVGHIIDIGPTLTELAAVELPTEVDGEAILPFEGRSLAPILVGGSRPAPDFLAWAWGGNRALRRGAWKIVWDKLVRRWELYNLESDATETNDLAARFPERVEKLKKLWFEWADRSELNFDTELFGPAPFQATGFKVGEVGSNSAIIWTRLTQRAKRNPATAPAVDIVFAADDPNRNEKRRRVERIQYRVGTDARDLRNAAPGMPGEVRVQYAANSANPSWQTTSWQPVDPRRDFTHQFELDGLTPGTKYLVRVEARDADSGQPGQSLSGRFCTAPAADAPTRVVFAVSTGQAYKDRDCADGFKIYNSILQLDPSFFVHTGDIVYYDRLAKSLPLARYHWQRTYGLPSNVNFHRQVASYFIKDDHDTWQNDCWPGMQRDNMFEFTFEQGLALFREQVPMGESTFRTRRWGKHLQVWLVEGRDFRSPNGDPDGPQKTIWGAEQKEWLKRSLAASNATFRVLISATPIVGPDRSAKRDNHSNAAFQHEGDEIRAFLAQQRNTVVVCGDRHWQYVSRDPANGLLEFSCGPASDAHAGGWKQENFVKEYHRYLNVVGGFLSATVEEDDTAASLTFRHHSVDGNVLFEERLTSD